MVFREGKKTLALIVIIIKLLAAENCFRSLSIGMAEWKCKGGESAEKPVKGGWLSVEQGVDFGG